MPANPTRRSRRPAGPPAPGSAFDAAVRMLARRPHARAELTRKLLLRGHPAEEVDGALARALELGYLDDGRFAEALVRHRSPARGRLAIAAELAQRGVGRELAEAAVAGLDRDAELETATRMARRELSRLDRAELEALLNRAGPKLLRRGFAAGVVREACRLALEPSAP